MKRPVLTWLGGLATSALDLRPGLAMALVLACAQLHAVDTPGGFWLEVTGVSNGAIFLRLNGTEPFEAYHIQSKSELLAEWDYELTLIGANGMGWSSFTVGMGNRSNALFLRALAQAEPPADGIPLPDLQLWLKAGVGIELTGGAVSTWRDQSGHGHHATQVVASARPVFVPTGVNGRPVMRFNGTNQHFNLPDFLSTNTQGEAFVVLKSATTAPTSGRGLWHLGAAPGGYYPSASGSISGSFGRSALTTDTGNPIQPIDQFHLYNAASETGRWISRINGATHFSTDQNVVAFTSSPLLGRNRPNNFPAEFEGDIAELLLFSRVLSVAERDAVGVYLNRKFGFTADIPDAPAGVSAVAISPSQVSLTWQDPAGMGTTCYVVERKSGGEGSFEQVADVRGARSYVDTGLMPGTSHVYRLVAWNMAGQSPPSEAVSVTTPAAGEELPVEVLQLWLRSDAGVLRNGAAQTVGAWQDQSGRGNDARQTAIGSRPIYVESTQGDSPSLRFDGTNDYLNLPDFLSSNLAGEVFVVLKTATNFPASHRGLWQLGSAPGGYYPSIAGYISASFGRNTVVLNTGVPAQPLSGLHLYHAVSQPGNWISRVNGAVHYNTTNNVVGFSTEPCLGRNRPNNFPNYFEGELVEVMVFDRALTPGERGVTGLYLNSRHGFAALPHGEIQLNAQTLSASQIALAWSQAGATNEALYTYTIERRTDTNGPFVAVAQVSGDTRYFDEGLMAGSLYSYRVRNSLIVGADPSNEAAAATLVAGSPVPLAHIALWLRAGDLTLSNEAPVAEWVDFRNPDHKAVQPDPSFQPACNLAAFNASPSVQFGGGTFLQLPAVLSNAASAEVFVVLQSAANSPSTAGGLWRFNNNGPTLFPDTNGAVVDAFGSSSNNESLAPLPDLTQPLIYSVSAAPGLWQSRFNGPLKQWITNNVVLFDGVPLLGQSTGGASAPFEGQIAELIVFNRSLTLPEQKAVRDGLALKYNITLDAPMVPADVALTRPDPSTRLVTWTPLIGSENGLECRLEIERRADSSSPWLSIATVARTESAWSDTSSLQEIDYQYRMRAVNDAGATPGDALTAPLVDADGDGLSDALEGLLGTDPGHHDTDGDGLPDGWEVSYGLNPLLADGGHGALGDFDLDGVSNSNEFTNLTNPADGVSENNPQVRLSVHRPARSTP